MPKLKVTGLLTTLLLFFLFFTQTYSQLPCLQNAWDSYNAQRYVEAIGYCNSCIDDFSQDARSKQREMERLNIPVPPVGSKVSDAEKNAIFARGLLNNIATAYWMKGRSAEYLYRQNNLGRFKRMAEAAYREACILKYGRTWNPGGFFWSPCTASSERLPIR